MKENFESAFEALLNREGGYVNNPADPGGETCFGITKRVAVKHGYTGEMRDLPLELAKSIAKSEYWDAVDCDDLPVLLDFQVFDGCYNSGPGRAKEWLAKIPQGTPAEFAVMRFNAERLLFLASLSTWPTFGKGWARRIANNLLRAAG